MIEGNNRIDSTGALELFHGGWELKKLILCKYDQKSAQNKNIGEGARALKTKFEATQINF